MNSITVTAKAKKPNSAVNRIEVAKVRIPLSIQRGVGELGGPRTSQDDSHRNENRDHAEEAEEEQERLHGRDVSAKESRR